MPGCSLGRPARDPNRAHPIPYILLVGAGTEIDVVRETLLARLRARGEEVQEAFVATGACAGSRS
jgi:hypothetical protein